MKQELLEALAETRQREADLGALITEEPPDPSGRWRVQDHLSHLSWLRERDARVIDAVRTGGDIPPRHEGERDLSAVIYDATRDQNASAVIANSQRSWDLLQAVIEACSEEDLARPHPHREGRKLVDESPADHVGAHLMWAYLDAGESRPLRRCSCGLATCPTAYSTTREAAASRATTLGASTPASGVQAKPCPC